MLRFVFFLLFITTVIVAPAQNQQQYLFSHLGISNGLSSDETAGVQQDKMGFIWIGTRNGLQRYEGQRLLTFHHSAANPKSIPDDDISWIKMDKKNRLWMVCGEGHAGYLNVTNFTFHEVMLPLADEIKRKKGIVRIESDNEGHIMIVFAKNEVVTYNETADIFSENFNPYKIPEKWKVNSIYQDKISGIYWVACDSGLVKYDPVLKTISYKGHNTGNDGVIKALGDFENVSLPFPDSHGRFWVQSWLFSGVGPFIYSYDTKSGKTISWTDELYNILKNKYHELYNITEDKSGTVWITGVNLLTKLNNATGRFELMEPDLPGEFSIRYDEVRALFEDNESNLWVSSNKGIYRFNPSAQLFHTVFNRRTGKDTVYAPDVTDVLQTRDSNILVTTWGNGIFSYNKNFTPVDINYITQSWKSGEGAPWCIIECKNGDIWRSHQGGILFVSYAATGKSEKIINPVFEGSTIRQISEDKDGNLWLSTQRGHLVKWNTSTKLFSLVYHFHNSIQRLYADKGGDIWVCTITNGLFKVKSATGEILAHYGTENEPNQRLSGSVVSDILQYNDSVFIIAGVGLNILNTKTNKITYFNSENGLPSNIISNIVKDRQGYIWITTQKGICNLDLQNGILNIYDSENGVHTNTFTLASANLLNDGRIAIGTAHDLIVFNPEELVQKDRTPPDVQITGVSLSNKLLPMDSISKLGTINLPHDQTSLTIEFSTLTYLNRYGITYMMEGLDKEWISAGFINQAVYNYLPPGSYLFKIKAENGKDIFSKGITTLTIQVNPPFWKSWWFYCVLALLAAGLLYWYDRERMQRLKTVEQMRSSIAGNLHEEINTALNNINLLSEIARIKADQQTEQSKDYIEEIHRQSHDMIISMDDMLWSIDPGNDNMGKTIDRMREFAGALQNRHDTVIELQAEDEIFSLKPDMKTRHEFILIYKFALRMLVEPLQSQSVNVQLDYIKSFLQLTIFSNDTRLPDNNLAVNKMIAEMKNRTSAIHGKFDIQSDEKGTAIMVEVKVKV